MMNIREAMQRLSMHRMELRRVPSGEWRISFGEDKHLAKDNTYFTDDLEDAVIMGGRMRSRRLQAF